MRLSSHGVCGCIFKNIYLTILISHSNIFLLIYRHYACNERYAGLKFLAVGGNGEVAQGIDSVTGKQVTSFFIFLCIFFFLSGRLSCAPFPIHSTFFREAASSPNPYVCKKNKIALFPAHAHARTRTRKTQVVIKRIKDPWKTVPRVGQPDYECGLRAYRELRLLR